MCGIPVPLNIPLYETLENILCVVKDLVVAKPLLPRLTVIIECAGTLYLGKTTQTEFSQ